MIEFILGSIVGTLAGVFVMALVQINHRPAGPIWHRTADRPPTAEDGDRWGRIWAYNIVSKSTGSIAWIAAVNYPDTYTMWTRTPGEPPE